MIREGGPERFDGGFVGPLLPPQPPPPAWTPAPQPQPSEALLAIPLAPRALAGQALDLLTRSDSGLRSASFYIGFLLLVTVGPAIALFALGILASAAAAQPWDRYTAPPVWVVWAILLALPAVLGYVGAGVEARALATAVIGGRAEGRPLPLRASIAVARQRFWQVLRIAGAGWSATSPEMASSGAAGMFSNS